MSLSLAISLQPFRTISLVENPSTNLCILVGSMCLLPCIFIFRWNKLHTCILTLVPYFHPCLSTPIVQFMGFFSCRLIWHLTGSAAVALHDPSRYCIELTIIATAAVQAGLPHAPCKCLQYYTHINHSTHPWKNIQTICLPTSLPENPIHSLYMWSGGTANRAPQKYCLLQFVQLANYLKTG